jgi:hypothetical protein
MYAFRRQSYSSCSRTPSRFSAFRRPALRSGLLRRFRRRTGIDGPRLERLRVSSVARHATSIGVGRARLERASSRLDDLHDGGVGSLAEVSVG